MRNLIKPPRRQRRRRTPQEIAALAAARNRSLLFALAGVLLAVLMLLMAGEFLALECVVLAALSLAAGISCAWAASAVEPQTYRPAGLLGGVTAALAYALPFVLVYAYRAITIDAETAGRLAGELSAAQATELVRQQIMPGLEYFRAQFISYALGYALFGLLFGGILGTLGGILAYRNTKPKE
jgi:hypothetical protein